MLTYCPYCFEKHRRKKMSKKVQNDILNFIERTIRFTKVDKIYITWFGGEPLLAYDVIDSLSQRMIELANKWKIQYSASIVTNGFLLTQKIVDMLYNFDRDIKQGRIKEEIAIKTAVLNILKIRG